MEDIDKLWERIIGNQGETFYTAKKLPFTYYIKGGEMFTDRRERSVTKSGFEKAIRKIEERQGEITGPKSLNLYGAPYIWAVLKGIGILDELKRTT